jgi:DNA-binding transcriptional regulator YhcF (GntR family)
MKDVYILKNGMTKEQMFRLRLMNGFNFPPITADAILELSNDFFQNNNTNMRDGQILYLAISEEEGPGKTILESSHKEVILTLDVSEDMEVYEKFGISAYRQHVLLRITQEAREQNALLTIKDLVKLLKCSYSTIKRDLKAIRERGFFIPIRGVVKDIGPSSHKVKILLLHIKGHTPSEIRMETFHTIKSIERYILDFSRVAILTERGESIDNIRLIVGITESLVKEYQEMYLKYKDSEYKQKIDELVNKMTVHDPPMIFKKNKSVKI